MRIPMTLFLFIAIAIEISNPALANASNQDSAQAGSISPNVVIQMGDTVIPLYVAKPDLFSSEVSAALNETEQGYGVLACRAGSSEEGYSIQSSGGCTTISMTDSDYRLNDGRRFTKAPLAKICGNQLLKSAAGNLKVLEVMNRCVRTLTLHSKAYEDITSSPLVRVETEDGRQFVTNSRSLFDLAKMNETKIIDERATCSVAEIGQHFFGRIKNASKCAEEKSKALVFDVCKKLNGIPHPETLVQAAPTSVTYSEAFNEVLEANYTMKCDF
jgi:hypothetical protein